MEPEMVIQIAEALLGVSVNFFLLFAFAGIVEGITEFVIAPLFEQIKWLTEHKWLLPMSPIPLGIAGACLYGFDLLFELSQIAGGTIPLTAFGMVLTGILIARGSNFIHQYTERFYPAKRG